MEFNKPNVTTGSSITIEEPVLITLDESIKEHKSLRDVLVLDVSHSSGTSITFDVSALSYIPTINIKTKLLSLYSNGFEFYNSTKTTEVIKVDKPTPITLRYQLTTVYDGIETKYEVLYDIPLINISTKLSLDGFSINPTISLTASEAIVHLHKLIKSNTNFLQNFSYIYDSELKKDVSLQNYISNLGSYINTLKSKISSLETTVNDLKKKVENL